MILFLYLRLIVTHGNALALYVDAWGFVIFVYTSDPVHRFDLRSFLLGADGAFSVYG